MPSPQLPTGPCSAYLSEDPFGAARVADLGDVRFSRVFDNAAATSFMYESYIRVAATQPRRRR